MFLPWSASRLLAGLIATDMTYPEVGATAAGELPDGYRHVRRRAVIGQGETAFREAATALMTWRMHQRAGVNVACTDPTARPGVTVVLGVGPGPFRLLAGCRVVYTVAEDRRQGFAYGTLPGHPETGEEAFIVHHRPGGDVQFEITAFSRPATWYTRIGRPLTNLAQDQITTRYLRALQQPSE